VSSRAPAAIVTGLILLRVPETAFTPLW